jgi:hydroxyethylthiazole kinase-like uncharacterized protein yjeF
MKLVLAEEMRALDKAAEEELGIPGLLLMENAGRAVADAATALLQDCAGKKIVVLAGKGNNGGDGLGAARWLQNRRALVTVVLSCAREDLSGSAADELQFYLAGGGELQDKLTAAQMPLLQETLAGADLIIDALLGTGFTGELRGTVRDFCQLVNLAARPVLAVDIPTGVNADDGSAGTDAIRAQATVTMALPKPGLYLYPGKRYVGQLTVADIGMPVAMLQGAASKGRVVEAKMIAAALPKRPANMHKGTAGRVLVVAGSLGYTGAAALCSTGCGENRRRPGYFADPRVRARHPGRKINGDHGAGVAGSRTGQVSGRSGPANFRSRGSQGCAGPGTGAGYFGKYRGGNSAGPGQRSCTGGN